MATITRYPTGDESASGTWTVYPTSPTTKWDKVDEVTADNDSTYIEGASTGAYACSTFSAFDVPAGATISEVRVYYTMRKTGTPVASGYPCIKTGTTQRIGTASGNPTQSYVGYSAAWTTNPATSAAWEVDEVNGTDAETTHRLTAFGVGGSDMSPSLRFTQVYCVVTYTIDRTATGSLKLQSPIIGGTATNVPPARSADAAFKLQLPVVTGTATNVPPAREGNGGLAAQLPLIGGAATNAPPSVDRTADGGLKLQLPILGGAATNVPPARSADGVLKLQLPLLGGTATNAAGVRTNLCTAPSFELDTNTDGLADNWSKNYWGDGTNTAVRVSSLVTGGRSYAQRMYGQNVAEDWKGANLGCELTGIGSIAEGDDVTASIYLLGSLVGTNITISVSIEWRNSGYGWIGTTDGGNIRSSLDPDDPLRFSVAGVAPANASMCKLLVNIGSICDDDSWDFVADCALLEKTDTLDDYFDGETPDGGGWEYAWLGTTDASISTATATGAGDDRTATGSLRVPLPLLGGTATNTPPARAADGSLGVQLPLLGGTATNVPPARSGSGGLTTQLPLMVGTGTNVPPARSASGGLRVQLPLFAGTATAAEVRSAEGGLRLQLPSLGGTATVERLASGGLALSLPLLGGTATNTPPARTAAGGFTVPLPSLGGTATATAAAAPRTASGGLKLQLPVISGHVLGPNLDLVATLCPNGWRATTQREGFAGELVGVPWQARMVREGFKAETQPEGWQATTRRD